MAITATTTMTTTTSRKMREPEFTQHLPRISAELIEIRQAGQPNAGRYDDTCDHHRHRSQQDVECADGQQRDENAAR